MKNITDTELKEKIKQFLSSKDDKTRDDWYFTNRRMAEIVLLEFMKDMFDIDINE